MGRLGAVEPNEERARQGNRELRAARGLEGEAGPKLDHARSTRTELAVNTGGLAVARIQHDRFGSVRARTIYHVVFRQVQTGAKILRGKVGMVEQIVGFTTKLDTSLVLSGKRNILE